MFNLLLQLHCQQWAFCFNTDKKTKKIVKLVNSRFFYKTAWILCVQN